jgi:hypothetical protein
MIASCTIPIAGIGSFSGGGGKFRGLRIGCTFSGSPFLHHPGEALNDLLRAFGCLTTFGPLISLSRMWAVT